MSTSRIAGTAALLVALTSCHPKGPTGPSAGRGPEIPIKRVVLYQNGVGFFERSGTVSGNSLTLQIRPTQINDLLKSLTVIDRSSGRAVSVSLPMDKTGAQKISELPDQVRNASGILDILQVFRGARITLVGSGGSATGRIVGVENIQAGSTGENAVADWRVTIKTDNNKLRIFKVDTIRRIDLEDRTLSVGLDQSLDVSLNEGNWKPIALTVGLVGNESHQLTASYIVEMPRWKPAYRLVIGGAAEKNGGPTKELLLQGWAVVDNVSGEDWNNVQLSLVAGTPMSFIYDLHSPQFTRRPDLSPRGQEVAIAPPRDQPGIGSSSGAKRATKSSGYGGGPSRSAAPPPSAPKAEAWDDELAISEEYAEEAPLDYDDELESATEARVDGASVGSLFRYDLQDPVTVPDRSSTLVAIVNKRVTGGDVVLFRPELSSGGELNPYRAAMLKNESGFTLEKGPVTIYAGGTFVGEGFLERMEKDTTAFVSYSLDGNVVMNSRSGTNQEGVRLLKIVDGMVISEVLEIVSTTYDIENRHPTPLTAYVKTQRRTGWKFRNQPAATITAPDSLMVPVDVPANGKAELVVEWVKKVERRERFNSTIALQMLDVYLQSGKAPPEVRKRLDEAIKLKGEIDEVVAETQRQQKLHRDLSVDAERVRKNLKMLGETKGNADLRRELEAKMATQERDLSKISGELVRLSEKQAELDKRLTALIRTISLTAD